MTSTRIALLNDINFFDLFSTIWEEKWNDNYSVLEKHHRTHGDFNLNHDDDDDDEMLSWIKKQRREYEKFEKSEKSTMTRSRIDKLDSINFTWYDTNIDPKFDAKIKELKAYKMVWGHVMVPKVHPQNKALGRWVGRMRCQYRLYQANKTSCLNPERISLLENIGLEWNSTSKFAPHLNWITRFNELVAYKAKFGHMLVPKKLKENEALGTWVRNQRCQYMAKKRGHKSPMTEERIKKLTDIGFEWKLK